MKPRLLLACLMGIMAGPIAARGQTLAKEKLSHVEKKAKTDAVSKVAPGAASLTNPSQPVTTEIYADQAFFDSAKNIGKFSGHVKVVDPRFNMQSDKLTAYISKESQGLEKAVSSGNVGVVRDRPDPKGGPPMRSIGLAENAVYTTKDGIVELSGNPRVQQGLNMHVATSPDTVMFLNQEGQLTTHGPSRTELRPQPSPSPTPSPGASASPGTSPAPTPEVSRAPGVSPNESNSPSPTPSPAP